MRFLSGAGNWREWSVQAVISGLAVAGFAWGFGFAAGAAVLVWGLANLGSAWAVYRQQKRDRDE